MATPLKYSESHALTMELFFNLSADPLGLASAWEALPDPSHLGLKIKTFRGGGGGPNDSAPSPKADFIAIVAETASERHSEAEIGASLSLNFFENLFPDMFDSTQQV